MRKILKIILIIIILNFSLFIDVYADDIDENEEAEVISQEEISEVANNIEANPITNSRKCIIYDRTTKMVLYGKNEMVKCPMASTTKIMSCLVVLENVENLNKTVEVTSKAAGTGGSRLKLSKGDKITIHDLLYGLMLRSGNDAAVALAIEVGGSIEGFAELMNKKALELGLTHTHFVTPHGLDNNEHYTTAYELALLTDYALNNEIFAKIVGTKTYTITVNGIPRTINNTNELLGSLNGVVGVKTGFTNGAGRCLVTETKRGDSDLITIVLGADTKKDRTKDSIKLIEYAFSNFAKINIKEKALEEFENWKNINISRFNIVKGKNNKIELGLSEFDKEYITVKETDIDKIEFLINTITTMEAPVKKGTQIGTLVVKLNEEIIETVDILCNKTLERKDWKDYFRINIGNCRTIIQDLFAI